MTILEKIKEVREKSKKRNFNQRFDLVINLKDLDLKKAESKIDELFALPKGIGRDTSITFFSDSVKNMDGCTVLSGTDMEKLSKDKKELKKLISQTDYFLAEPKLMIVAGKHLGKFLAPKGKMPRPVSGNVERMVEDTKKSVKILVGKYPIIHTVVGSEKMDDNDLEENIKAVINFLKMRLSKGKNNIKNVYLKLTMGHPVKLEVE